MIAVLPKRPHAAGRNRNRIPPVDVNPKNSFWRPTGIFTISLFSDKKSKLNINRRLVEVCVSPSGCWWENQANQAFLLATCFIYVDCWRFLKSVDTMQLRTYGLSITQGLGSSERRKHQDVWSKHQEWVQITRNVSKHCLFIQITE